MYCSCVINYFDWYHMEMSQICVTNILLMKYVIKLVLYVSYKLFYFISLREGEMSSLCIINVSFMNKTSII